MSVSRRRFLRGASGVAVGLPFLEMLAPRRVSAQAVPKRAFIIATGFSMDVERSYERESFWASGDEDGIGTLSEILQPLSSYSDRISIVGGIDNVIAPLMQSNGHNASGKTLLSPYPVKSAFDGSGDFSRGASCDWDSEVAGPSIDNHLADRLGTPLLPLSIGDVNSEHAMRWRRAGSSVVFDEGITDPQRAFDRLFTGGGSAGATGGASGAGSPLAELRARRGSVLDAVLDQFRTVHARAGRLDRQRLEQHADLIRSVEREVGATMQIVCDNPTLSIPDGYSAAGRDLLNWDGVHDDILLRAMGEVTRVALSCQATQVASVHMRNMQTNTFPWLNGGSPYIPANWHAVVHHDEGTAEQRRTIYRWHASAFAELLDAFAATPDGPDSTLLDNTLVVWASSLRHSPHSTDDLPVMLIGDLQGTLRTGRLVDYEPRGGRSLGDLWTTVLHAMDVEDNDYGFNGAEGSGGRPLRSGPLIELFS